MSVLEEPPEPEGDDSEAGGGKAAEPVTEDELADADEQEEDPGGEDGADA